ncbi:MAG TPA: ABC transporter substrate-binding protein, partial [Halobacteriales archaeon]|nr:ABC transporter substrate-binding protein [Halobacteriales archaeon]
MPSEEDRLSRRSYLKFAGAATASVSIAGCSGGDGGDGGDGDDDGGSTPMDTETDTPSGSMDVQVGVTMGNMDSGLDPQDHAETNTDIVVSQGYEGLLDRAPDGSIIEGLASDWERVEPGTVRFTLRDASFHSGDPLTAEDVAFSIRRIVFDDVSITSPQNTDLGAVAEVQPGDGEVTVNFDGLNPIAFQLFATNGEIMQQSWVEGNSRDYINQNLNGTGPFQLSSYDSGNEVVLERFDDYWGGAADVGG